MMTDSCSQAFLLLIHGFVLNALYVLCAFLFFGKGFWETLEIGTV
jgi:hypothetical protein